MNCSLDGSWVAVQVHAKRERSVDETLRLHGYETFLPCYAAGVVELRAAGKERPLFPGYVFCRYKTRCSYRIVQAYAVVRIVNVGGTPAPVTEPEIEAIRQVVESGLLAEPWRSLGAGDAVHVCKGPLRGLCGTLITMPKGARLVINVELLQRSIAVEVDVRDVMPAVWPKVTAREITSGAL